MIKMFYCVWLLTTVLLNVTAIDCPPTWAKFGISCYKKFDNHLPWHDARQACQKEGAELVSIQSKAENEFVLALAGKDNSWCITEADWKKYLWIGLSVEARVRPTHWANGDSNDPNNQFGIECVQMINSDVCLGKIAGHWADWRCADPIKYMCEKTWKPEVTPEPLKHEICPETWTHFGESCYKKFDNHLSWPDARQACIREGADLVTIHSKAENDFVLALAGKDNSLCAREEDWRKYLWIGFLQNAGGQPFYWANGDSKYQFKNYKKLLSIFSCVNFTYWAPSDPNNQFGIEHCVEMINSDVCGGKVAGHWADWRCPDPIRYMCKMKAKIPTTTPPTTTKPTTKKTTKKPTTKATTKKAAAPKPIPIDFETVGTEEPFTTRHVEVKSCRV